ncbi:MAG: hypothetical protein AB4426_03015 [Xenococcaceae cyanobacterium]
MKRGWWDAKEFVSPCQADCEKRFSYKWNGKIAPVSEGDTAATKTISILGLGTDGLKDKRRRAIAGFFGFSKKHKTKELSQRNAKALLAVIGKPDSTGRLKEFCFVFEQLLPKYIKQP